MEDNKKIVDIHGNELKTDDISSNKQNDKKGNSSIKMLIECSIVVIMCMALSMLRLNTNLVLSIKELLTLADNSNIEIFASTVYYALSFSLVITTGLLLKGEETLNLILCGVLYMLAHTSEKSIAWMYIILVLAYTGYMYHFVRQLIFGETK